MYSTQNTGAFGDPFGLIAAKNQAAPTLNVGDPFGLKKNAQPMQIAGNGAAGVSGGMTLPPISTPSPFAPSAKAPTPTAKPQPATAMVSSTKPVTSGAMKPVISATAPTNENTTLGLREISESIPSSAGEAYTIGLDSLSPIRAGQISETDLSAYMNPYTQNVTDIALADLARQNEILRNGMSANAESAGAFGGSRHGVAEAETNRAYLDQVARTTAEQNQNAYNTALGAAQFDISARAGADTTNAQNELRVLLADQAARNGMAQFNSNLGLDAANLQTTLQNLGFGQQQQLNGQLMGYGNMIQGQQQQLIDAARDQFTGFATSPQQSLATILSAISGVPSPVSTEESYTPGLLDLAGIFI